MHIVFGSFFTTFFVKPIFNVLTAIYALIPGHNFGLALIIFTVVVRVLMYPLLKKQLLHTKMMRDLKPELDKIKKAAAGNRQKESLLTMELYKERNINPVASLGIILVQIPIILALFSGLRKIVDNPQAMIDFSYSWVRDLSWMKHLASDIKAFDNTLFGVVDLGKSAIGKEGSVYIPALIIVFGSSVIQYFQIKQTSPATKETRKLRQILKDAGSGKTADQAEVNAALGRNMSFVFPVIIFMVTVSFAAALSLYWFIGGLIAFLQQDYLLKKDNEALLSVGGSVNSQKNNVVTAKNSKQSKRTAEPIEAEIVSDPTISQSTQKTKKAKKKSAAKRKKRR